MGERADYFGITAALWKDLWQGLWGAGVTHSGCDRQGYLYCISAPGPDPAGTHSHS